ncbi:polysaccharide biosynthesis/export family protein [Luteolibacter marinus]|uniref:polysaccharide biosynthesis/export family protein n=1 Tax=Luteolibacter marinus TaxID=2776705 RepID=UPI0018670C9D|nr:polysaccharide biosynthesis/export family protein [Luteolibacter marinus]
MIHNQSMNNASETQVGTQRHENPEGDWKRILTRAATTLMAIAAFGLFVAISGCETAEEYTPIPAEAYKARPSGTLAAGDVIQVSYPGAPELNTTQKIQANGQVSLPTIGNITAQGKSVATLQSQLTGLYQAHLQNPAVLVAVESAASGVYVSGEVMKPGKVPLDRPMTAFEAIMEAGGFTKFANPKQVVVVRSQNGQHQRYALNLSDTLSGQSSNAFYLRPYDVVYVKQSRW